MKFSQAALFIAVFFSQAWAATGQVGAFVVVPSPSPSPSPAPSILPSPTLAAAAPITGFAVAVSNGRNFFDFLSEMFRGFFKPFGLLR